MDSTHELLDKWCSADSDSEGCLGKVISTLFFHQVLEVALVMLLEEYIGIKPVLEKLWEGNCVSSMSSPQLY